MKVEVGEYLVPISNTDPNERCLQTSKVPTIHSVLDIPGLKTLTYLRFSVHDGTESALDISVGATDLETASQRIRAQMKHILETSGEFLQREDPPPGLVTQIELISKYFICR